MSLGVEIKDDDSDIRARVTKYGQLVTAPLQYSTPVEREMLIPDLAYNFIEPQPGQEIIVTDIIASADRNVSNTTPADVMIYESDGIDSLVNIQNIARPQLVRSANASYTGLNLIIPQGTWLNAITDDAGILLFIYYYYVPAPRSI